MSTDACLFILLMSQMQLNCIVNTCDDVELKHCLFVCCPTDTGIPSHRAGTFFLPKPQFWRQLLLSSILLVLV